VPDENDRQIFFVMAKAWAELASKEQAVFKIPQLDDRHALGRGG
jgi:hypothetical protein